MELIGGQSYAGRVYTGGVTSTSTVQSTGAIVCTQTGCKWAVIQYAGRPPQPGDSGGSMYIPGATGQVLARGSVIAGNGTTSLAEPWNRVSSAMGVSIAL